MIVHLNGRPGVGKLTIGRELLSLVGGRLLDSHSIYNVAFRLTDFASPEFYDAVRAARGARRGARVRAATAARNSAYHDQRP